MTHATCRTCTRTLGSPYRVYDERGKVIHGCVDPDHTGHLVTPSESAHWHYKAQVWAKKLYKGRTPLQEVQS